MRRLVALVVGVALVAGACTTDESGDATTTTATATTEAPDTTTTTATATTEAPDTTTTSGPLMPDPVVNVAAVGTPSVSGDTVAAVEPLDDLENSGGLIHLVDVGQLGGANQAPPTMLSNAIWTGPPDEDPEEPVSCVFARGLIVTTRTAAGELDVVQSFSDTALAEGLELVNSDGDLGPFGEIPGVGEIVVAEVEAGTELTEITRILSEGEAASFYYPVTPSPRWQYGPASSPRPVAADLAGATPQEGDSVHVIDLFTVTGSDIDGHGAFVLGILQRMGVETSQEDVVFVAGDPAGDETRVVKAFDSGINNLSAGTRPCVVEIDGTLVTLVPLGLAAGMHEPVAAGAQVPGWIVASAGNHGDASGCIFPQYPAAFALGDDAWGDYADLIAPDTTKRAELQGYIDSLAGKTVSVGATASPDALDARADFSACDGNGVTVWAPGTNILSDYEDGIAAWDGTSFAAPQVAGLIALGLYPPP